MERRTVGGEGEVGHFAVLLIELMGEHEKAFLDFLKVGVEWVGCGLEEELEVGGEGEVEGSGGGGWGSRGQVGEGVIEVGELSGVGREVVF